MKMPEYFTDKELMCHCGCGLLPPKKSVERLYALRAVLHYPLEITSSARCEAHNKAIGGAEGSIHLPEDLRLGRSSMWGGGAFDILVPDNRVAEFIARAVEVGFRGFGIGNGFVHIDDAKRPYITSWKY